MCSSCEPALCRLSTCEWGPGQVEETVSEPSQHQSGIRGQAELQGGSWAKGASSAWSWRWLAPNFRKVIIKSTICKGKKGKVSCGASRDEGKTFRSWFLESSYKMQFGDNPKAVMARRYLLLSLIRVRGMFAKLFAAVLHCLSFYEQSL